MKTELKTEYVCEICGTHYGTAEAALLCESKPVSQDKGVKIGDVVLITSGDGTGKKAKVKARRVLSREYGHYQWERYWHTVSLEADVINSWGTRFLTFDSYEVTP